MEDIDELMKVARLLLMEREAATKRQNEIDQQ